MDKIFAALGGTTKFVDIIVKLVIAGVIFFALRSLYIRYKRRNAGKQYVDKSALNPNINYDALAKGVEDATSGILLSGAALEDIAQQLVVLNNNELRQVNNRYLELYGKGKKTIQDAFDNSWVCIGCSNLEALRLRLRALGIN